MYRYETHLHTLPVSKCAKADVRTNLLAYKALGFDGVFITNHFIDGNIAIDPGLSYAEKIEYYFSDYEEALALADGIGIRVFCGVELSYKGTDFLVYGLDKAWFLAHPEIQGMKKTQELQLMLDEGALIIQAHPYREASYIDHIRLFPRHVQGVEVYNACRDDFCNQMARHYADAYGLLHFAGTDNHTAHKRRSFGGMECETPIADEADFVTRVLNGTLKPFRMEVAPMLFLQYPPCTTCQKAKAWLDERGVFYESRHIKEQSPTYEELKSWHQRSGLPLKRFFNTSGLAYKALGLKDKLPTMTEEEQLQLLATDGMLVKRPILLAGDRVLVGFREKEWQTQMQKA